jgi:hypothetical protein
MINNSTLVKALQYIKNTGGGATWEDFDDDHEPVGPLLRKDIPENFVRTDDKGKLFLTKEGEDALS